MRKYADKPEPDVQTFLNTYGHFLVKTGQMQTAPPYRPPHTKTAQENGHLHSHRVGLLVCL